MNIRQALKKFVNIEIELLLAHVLKKPKEFVFLNPEVSLLANQLISLSALVKRRQGGEPIAYILGYKDFMGLRFEVNKDVLIPRPETEWLVEKIVTSDKLQVTSGRVRVLDVGTGSGAIIISLVKGLGLRAKGIDFVASDISGKALKVAKQNAKAHKVKINFVQSDLFKNISGKFDIVVANLPYVPKKIYDLRFKDLRFEPKLALIDRRKDFDIYKRFFQEVGKHLNPKGLILLEIDPSSKKFLIEYQQRFLPSGKMKFCKDFNNLGRYAEIKI